MATLAQPTHKFARKPAAGTTGRTCTVLVNYYRCKTGGGERYQFDVTFSVKLPKPLAREIFAAEFPDFIYDGDKIGFSMTPIAEKTVTHKRNDKGREEEIKITIKPTTSIKMEGKGENGVNEKAVQLMEVLIRQFPSKNMLEVGRNKYFRNAPGAQTSGGVELRSGFFQSIVSTAVGPVMNIDIASCAFWKGTGLVSVISELLNMRDPAAYKPSNTNAVTKLRGLKTLKVSVKHGPREMKYGITSMSREGANKLSFDYQGKQITVAQYFQQVYSKKLSFPNLPCVVIQKPGKSPIHIPAELCTIVPGQVYKRKLDPQQTSDMIKYAAKKPFERASIIKGGLESLGYPVNDFLQQFQVSMTPEMMSVKSRILNPPKVVYGASKIMQPRDGSWNMKDVKVVEASTVKSWGVLVTSGQRDLPRVQDYMRAMIQEGTNLGMKLPDARPPIQFYTGGPILDALKTLYTECQKIYGVKPDVLIVVYDDNDHGNLYNQTKYVAECKIGFMTQFLNAAKLSKANSPQYAANMWLKINAKLGGINAVVSPADMTIASGAPTMILGADVSHPAPDDSGSPSICAVTGSIDRMLGKYACVTSYQGHRVEIIQDLKASVTKLLTLFRQKNRVLPARLIFFRDGVGEGQFHTVNSVEIQAIKDACKELYKAAPLPKLLFCIIVKRHHARFFPANPQDADRSGNVKAGMVIDTDITSPYLYDFFLQSHAGLQGTNRSMHYYVLNDDLGMKPDALHMFINATCYTFCRCTRSVKMPPSAYYAHLAADRARKWIAGGTSLNVANFPNDNQSISSGTSGQSVDFSWCPKPAAGVAAGMYFA